MDNTFYRNIVNKSPYAYSYQKIILNSEGNPVDFEFIDINEKFETVIGLNREAILGKRMTELVPITKDEKTNWIGPFGEVALNGGSKEFTLYSHVVNLWLKIYIYSSEKYYITTYFNDISDEKNIINELDKFFDVNLDLLCIADTDGNFVKLNKAWENILGYSTKELKNKKFIEFVHPDDIEETLNTLSSLRNQNEVLNFVNRYRCKDGSYRFIEWRSTPHGKTIYAAARDITDKIETQRALKEKEENFRNFFETMDDLIFVALPDASIIYTNSAVSRKLGYPEDTLTTMNILEVHPEIYREEAGKIFEEMFKGERDFCPLPLLKDDGGFFPVETRIWFGKWDGRDCLYGISKDISKQQSALEKFQKIFDVNPAIMAVSSTSDGKFIDINYTFVNKLGYTKDEVIGKTSRELNLFTDIDKQINSSKQLETEGRIREVELCLRKKDGSILNGLFYGEIIDNQGEKVFLTVMIDITQQRKSEKEAFEAKVRMEAILDNLPHLAWLKDNQGRFIAVNKHFADSCGKTIDEIINHTDLDIWPLDLALKYQNDDKEVLSGKKIYVEELINDKQGGKWFETFKTPIFDANGTIVGTTGMSRDITARKNLEIELKSQKDFLNQIIDAIPDLLFFKDLSSTYLGCNKAFAENFIGLASKDIIGKTDLDLIKDPETANSFLENDLKAINNDKASISEETVIMANGEVVDLETIKTPFFDSKGNPLGLIGISRDITERKKASEELLKAKQAAESANVMKGQFLANMSHEIRTPINGVMGFIDLLSKTKVTPEQAIYLNDAKSASEVLLYLINDILDFSKIESGKFTMEKINFKLRTTVDGAVSILAPKAEEKGIEVNLLIKSNVPDEIEGDPSRLRQIINNLVGNAIKFTSNGEVNVVVETLEENPDFSVIGFKIQDTGIGISDEYKRMLFQPFTQGDASTTRKFGGTGLGLAITKELVKMMDGEISVESTLGEGSTFSFTIKTRVISKYSKEKPSYVNLKGINVLVVDDNKTNREIARAYLKDSNCNVFEAADASQAITSVITALNTGNTIDIALLDYHMPLMNGMQLAATLQAMPLTKDLKLILLTSAAQKGDASTAKDNGFSGYLAKPIKRDDLLDCISIVLGLHEETNIQIVTKHTVEEYKDSSKKRILLVEDNEMNVKLFVAMLKLRNFSCDIASNGKEALQAISAKNYDIVFMDCQMPVMDGYEATEKIRELESDKQHTYIVAMTANAMEGDREKCIASGMDNYISKPFDSKKLFEIIEEKVGK